MGGSDQWGNIVNGIELGRRTGAPALFGLTTPLLTTSNGEKMGKTAGGAVWLDPEMLAPYDFWQFWRNTSDADLKRCLAVFSDMPMAGIDEVDMGDVQAVNEAKKSLADSVTTLVHGKHAAEEARRQADKLFGGLIDEVTHRLATDDIRSVPDLLVAIGFASSKSEGRRLMAGNGVRIGEAAVTDDKEPLAAARGDRLIVSVGKKRRAFVEFA
jgi:tyrosyl-tRNA synthetase